MVEGPLNGVRILDLTHVWAGPLGTRILADLGADVVKVEAPLSRGPAVRPTGGGGTFIGGNPGDDPWNRVATVVKLNRNKQSLAIDLKAESGRLAFLELVATADVVIENFSARAMPSLGLGYDALQAANPAIIYVAMPGYGTYGPYSEWVAYGPSVEPMSGFDTVMGYDADNPRNTGMALPDAIGGVTAAAAVIAALNRRKATGDSAMVEVTLHEAATSFNGEWLIGAQRDGPPVPRGNRFNDDYPCGVFRAAGEDEWIAIECRSADEADSLAAVIDGDPGDDADVEAFTSRREKHVLEEQLQAAGIAAGALATAPDMLMDPQVAARGFFVSLGRDGQESTPFPGLPIVIDGITKRDWRTAPLLGEHNRQVLHDWLEYDDERIDALYERGVLVDRPPDSR